MKINEPIKALSWKEPFASLMLHGKIETRTWKTNYRGLVLICATKKAYTLRQLFNITSSKQAGIILDILKEFHPGYAIAVGTLIDCRKMKKEDEDKCFVEYHHDLYCHVYQDVRPIKPIPWKGKQGWSNVPQNIIDQIEFISDLPTK